MDLQLFDGAAKVCRKKWSGEKSRRSQAWQDIRLYQQPKGNSFRQSFDSSTRVSTSNLFFPSWAEESFLRRLKWLRFSIYHSIVWSMTRSNTLIWGYLELDFLNCTCRYGNITLRKGDGCSFFSDCRGIIPQMVHGVKASQNQWALLHYPDRRPEQWPTSVLPLAYSGTHICWFFRRMARSREVTNRDSGGLWREAADAFTSPPSYHTSFGFEHGDESGTAVCLVKWFPWKWQLNNNGVIGLYVRLFIHFVRDTEWCVLIFGKL